MKTALQTVKKEIAELWSSPGDDPNYTQIFEVLERNLKKEKQQIIEACNYGHKDAHSANPILNFEQYYNNTFNQPLKGI